MRTKTDLEDGLTSPSSRPLCRRYALAIVRATLVRIRGVAGTGEHPLFWVFGWLADGECEPLGLCMGEHAIQPMLDAFKTRGIERIWHVESTDDARAEHGAQVRFAVDRTFPGALTSSRPPMLSLAEALVGDLSCTLTEAVRHHGHFENEAAAIDFFARALRRAENRLDRERQVAKERPRPESGAQTATQAA